MCMLKEDVTLYSPVRYRLVRTLRIGWLTNDDLKNYIFVNLDFFIIILCDFFL